MTKMVSGVKNLTKTALLWLTLCAVGASIYGGLIASQPEPRTLTLAEVEADQPVAPVTASLD
ncbi:MAG: hypothetical protein VX501_01215 [Pseudomonadota bacterium]|nr:hypothetical protein [Pseudomonadota bacterium]